MATEKEKKDLQEQEEILKNEDNILDNLFKASGFAKDKKLQQKIKIERKGVKFFEFVVRPITQKELSDCRKKATKRVPNPTNAKLPLIDSDVDYPKLYSHKIYIATIDEDRAKIWENKDFLKAKNLISGVDAIDTLLLAGEKNRIDDIIDDISGFNDSDYQSEEEYAKNS